MYVWADGIYSGLRAEQTKLCALVVIGVNERGEKRFLAIEDGVRESTQSWREVLLKLKSRGMNIPELAIGDGAMGFWAALEEIYPETRQQRCWMHKTMNVLNGLPKSAQAKAKLHAIWKALAMDARQEERRSAHQSRSDRSGRAIRSVTATQQTSDMLPPPKLKGNHRDNEDHSNQHLRQNEISHSLPFLPGERVPTITRGTHSHLPVHQACSAVIR